MSGSSPEGPGSMIDREVGARQKNSRRHGRWSSGHRSISPAGSVQGACAVSSRLHWSFSRLFLAADRSATMGIRGRTYFLGAQKDKYPRGCAVDRMRQKGERPQKHLKFGTSALLPTLADPYYWIYQKKMPTRNVGRRPSSRPAFTGNQTRERHHVVEN